MLQVKASWSTAKGPKALRLRAESLKAVRWGLKVERLGSLRD